MTHHDDYEYGVRGWRDVESAGLVPRTVPSTLLERAIKSRFDISNSPLRSAIYTLKVESRCENRNRNRIRKTKLKRSTTRNVRQTRKNWK